MPDQPQLSIVASAPDGKGRRLVVTTYGDRRHKDSFDIDAAYVRRQWREAVRRELKIRGDYWPGATGEAIDAAVYEALETALQAAVDDADSSPAANLWQAKVSTMADMQNETTEWLWPGHFPLGAISGIDGDPGLGKSQLTCDLAARVTNGVCMPPQSAPIRTFKPRGVLMLNAEDDPTRTIRPRLEAAGADLARVHFMRSMAMCDDEDERPVCLPTDLPAIEQTILDHDVALVVVDPFVAYLASDINVNNDADVRRCLSQLATVAESTRAAVVLIRHLNKKSGLSAVYRGGGSIGITGACRAVFMVGQDPADSDGRILAPIKNNLAPEPPSLRFTIESHGTTSRVRWGDACDVSAHDCLDAKQERKGGKLDEAKAILLDVLGAGARGSSEVEGAMKSAGVSDSTYWRARRAIGVEAEKAGFSDGQWLLSLPAEGGEKW